MRLSLTFAVLCRLHLGSDAYKVTELTDSNFYDVTAGKAVFIKAFAPWCGHCKKMAPAWELLAAEWEGHEYGLVAEVDCTSDDGAALCQELEVTGYPTLFFGDPHALERYEGDRDYESLADFAKEEINQPICSVFRLDACDADTKAQIQALMNLEVDALEKMRNEIDEELDEMQVEFDKGVDEINEMYEKLVDEYNEKIDKVRDETNYKWLTQIVAKNEMEGTNEPEL